MWMMALVGRSYFKVRFCVFVLGGRADPAALQDLSTVKMLVLQSSDDTQRGLHDTCFQLRSMYVEFQGVI